MSYSGVLAANRLAKILARTERGTNGCLIYPGVRPETQYPVLFWNGKYMAGHRLVWMLTTGEAIPEGIKACPKCDMPACVNVDHIFLGTQSENMLDAVSKGRWRGTRTDDQMWRKLSPDAVRTIRAMYAAAGGQSHRTIARRFGVSARYVGRILNGERCKAVA